MLISNLEYMTYSLYTYDANGCVYKALSDFNVFEVLPPSIDLRFPSEVCEGSDFNLSGSLSPEDAEYRIIETTSGNPEIIQNWTLGPDINFTVEEPELGQYSYEIEYRDPATGCTETAVVEFEVIPTYEVEISYQLESCTPYVITLNASNTAGEPGTYTWNNGMSGQQITVTNGGPYRVTFHPEQGCNARATEVIPKSPDVYTWVFPTGCFEYCPDRNRNEPYIIGPIPEFTSYLWDNAMLPVSGIEFVDDYILFDQQGALDLTLNNGLCDFTTETLDLSTSEFCFEDCQIDLNFEEIQPHNSGGFTAFVFFGTVVNNYGQNITVEFSSSSGTFIPSHISIPPGQAYDFISNPPLQFIADTNFNGTLNMNVQVTMGLHGIVCNEIHTYSLRHLMRPAPSEQLVNFKAYPNPVKAHTQVAYELELEDQAFEGGELRLYSIAGNLLESRGLKRAQGVEEFNLSHLAPGKYILVFLHKGKRINQQVLIKE